MTLQLSQVIPDALHYQDVSINRFVCFLLLWPHLHSRLRSRAFLTPFFPVSVQQQASDGTENTKHVTTDLLLEQNTAEVVWSWESYKMLASTPGQSDVDARSCSLFVKGEISISDAKGQLLLAGPPPSRCWGQKSVRVVSKPGCSTPRRGQEVASHAALSVAMRPDRCKNPLWVLQLLCGFAWIWSTSAPIMHHCRGRFEAPAADPAFFSLQLLNGTKIRPHIKQKQTK